MRRKGIIIVVSGFSGAGKGTLMKKLTEVYDTYALSVSMTTRAPRPGEVDGKHYYFASREEFLENIEKDNFLEYATVFDNMYGTPKDAVLKRLDRGHNVILEIDVQGGLLVKKAMPEAILVFILPPSNEVLRQRLEGRGTDSPEVIEKRLAGALNEIKLLGEYDYYVVNDDLATAIDEVKGIIRAEGQRVPAKVAPIVSRYE